MNTYSAYKDSGEQWLGQIPAHWEMKRLAACFAKRSENWKRGETLELLSLLKDVGIVPYSEKGNIGNTAKTDFSQYKVARKGDLVINSMNVIIGSLGITPMDGYISPAYYAFAPREGVNTRYYNYILSLRRAQQNIRRFSKGIMEIRLKISANDFLSIQYPVPPKDEQEAMVAYLDEQTAQIDSAIAREQKMIDLLEERKQIIIQHAVTKGLYPNAKMKDSGINDLGVIPECWEVKRLGVLGLFSKGGNISRDNLTEEGECEAILYGDIYTKYTYFAQNIHNHISLQTAKQAVPIYGGDILMAGSGETKEDIGKTIIYQGDQAYAGGDVIIFRQKGINGKYLSYALNSQYAKDYRYRVSKGEIVVHIYPYALKNLYLPIPPVEDQEAIVKYLDKHIANVNCAIDAREKMIALLQERKQIIINEVVTGKIKVL